MYLISKLLLNSLYGRFGMSLDLESLPPPLKRRGCVDDEDNLLLNYDYISDIVSLNNGKAILSYIKNRGDSEITSKNVSPLPTKWRGLV